MTKEVMTAAKAAKLLNVTEETIQQWIHGEPPSAAPTVASVAADAPKREAVYTANSALRRAFAASQIIEVTSTESAEVPDSALSQAITSSVVEAPDREWIMPSSASTEAESEFEIPPPEVVAEVAECISLFSETKAAFASALTASTSLMQRSAIEVLEALRGDLAALAS